MRSCHGAGSWKNACHLPAGAVGKGLVEEFFQVLPSRNRLPVSQKIAGSAVSTSFLPPSGEDMTRLSRITKPSRSTRRVEISLKVRVEGSSIG